MCAFGGRRPAHAVRDERAPGRPDDELARFPQSGGVFAMRVDVPGRARAAVRGLTRAVRDGDLHRSRRVPAHRRAAGVRHDRVRRVVRHVDRRHPRGVVLRPGHLPRAPRAQHAPRLRHRHRSREALHGRACARPARRRSPPATRRSRSAARRCASACRGRASRCSARSPTSISAAGRGCRRSAGCVRPRSGRRRSRSTAASRCTASARSSARSTSAASSCIRRSTTRWASTRASRTRTRRSRGARAAGQGAWGVFVHTPGMVSHGVGHPDWSHRSYAVVVEDEALDLFLFAGDDAGGDHRPATRRSPGARRRCRAGASGCGCRATTTRRRSRRSTSPRKLRERRIPCDVLTLDARATWKTSTRFDFTWDAERYPRSRGRARSDQGARPARLRRRISVRVGALAAVPGAGAARVSCSPTTTAPPASSRGTSIRRRARSAGAMTPLPESGIVDFTNPAAFASGATRTARCSRTAST